MTDFDESKIPHGVYCYTITETPTEENGWSFKTKVCPYWYSNPDQTYQMNGGCEYLQTGDWEEGGTFLLWDQCKECGINDDFDDLK